MGTAITAIVVIGVVGLIVKNMVGEKKKGNSIHCGGACKDCGGRCH